MKKSLFSIAMLVLTTAAFSQCLTVSNATFTQVGTGSAARFTLKFDFTTSTMGRGALNTVIKCGSDVIKNECQSPTPLQGAGTLTFTGLKCGDINTLSAIISAYTTGEDCERTPCSSITIMSPAGGPLPIKLSSFTAARSKQVVTLNWNTEFEIDAKEFIVERAEGTSFHSVGTISSNGNSSTSKSYSFNDKNENVGVTYYRLKNVDLNGRFTYSEIRTVKGFGTLNNVNIFPNPVRSNSTISVIGVTVNSSIQLLDFSGKILKSLNSNTNNSLDLTGVKNGTYLIRIIDKATNETVNKTLTVSN